MKEEERHNIKERGEKEKILGGGRVCGGGGGAGKGGTDLRWGEGKGGRDLRRQKIFKGEGGKDLRGGAETIRGGGRERS